MKNILRICSLLFFTGFFIYLILACYGVEFDGKCISLYTGRMVPHQFNGYMDPLHAFSLFCPVIIMLLSFVWKRPFNVLQRISLYILAAGSIVPWLFLLYIRAFGLNVNYYLIELWSTGSMLWMVLLAAAPNWNWVNWPFSKKGN